MSAQRIQHARFARAGSGAAKRRGRASRALRESEVRYHSLFENMKEGVAYCRMIHPGGQPRDFVYLAVNEAFEKLTGLRGVTGMRVSEAIPGIRDTDPELLEIYDRVASTGKPERFEWLVKALDLWFSVSVYRPKRGHFVAIFDVITERKRAEADLKLFRVLIESTVDAIHVVDPKTARFLDVNKSACESLGYTREEMLRKTVMDVTEGIDFERFEANNRLMEKTGRATVDSVRRRKDGATFPTEVSLFADQGRPRIPGRDRARRHGQAPGGGGPPRRAGPLR